MQSFISLPRYASPAKSSETKHSLEARVIRQLFGFSGFPPPRRRSDNGFLAHEPHEAERLLRRFAQSGIRRGSATFHIPIAKARQERAKSWIEQQTNGDGKLWIAVCPGSKMPVKIWPEERFAQVVHQLIADFDVWPVVFGSAEEHFLAERLSQSLAKGHSGLRPIRNTGRH